MILVTSFDINSIISAVASGSMSSLIVPSFMPSFVAPTITLKLFLLIFFSFSRFGELLSKVPEW
jgi:hypothetical protein